MVREVRLDNEKDRRGIPNRNGRSNMCPAGEDHEKSNGEGLTAVVGDQVMAEREGFDYRRF